MRGPYGPICTCMYDLRPEAKVYRDASNCEVHWMEQVLPKRGSE